MKIEGYNPHVPLTTAKPVKAKQNDSQDQAANRKNFQQAVQESQAREKTVHLNTAVSREIMKDYAEYYFKQGRQLEEVKSYKQAISAYEKSNIVEPDFSKGKSVLNVRNKEFRQ